jgi:DNA-binding PucR family transcriptional regulator
MEGATMRNAQDPRQRRRNKNSGQTEDSGDSTAKPNPYSLKGKQLAKRDAGAAQYPHSRHRGSEGHSVSKPYQGSECRHWT